MTTTVGQVHGRLAVDGGEAIVPGGAMMISRWPRIEASDIERLADQLRAGVLTEMTGHALIREFEARVARLTGTRYGLTTNSGTSALHCALAGAGVEPGDEVVVPALGYIGCAAVVVHQGAIPIFADVDPLTFNVDAATVAAALSDRTRAVIVVHLHGLPAPMDELHELCADTGVALVEDFSHAVGASHRGRPVGGLGTVGAASVMAGKNLPAAGEGGILVTSDRDVRNRAARLKVFGEAVDADGGYQLVHDTLGWNYRSNPLSLSLAARQLDRLAGYNEARRANAMRLDATLAELPGFVAPATPSGARHVYHMYRLRIDPRAAGIAATADQTREALRQAFWAEGLPLVEFQNAPLPAHPLLRDKRGLGRGCPWSCHGREDVTYEPAEYPGALDALRHSLVIGMPSHGVLCNDEVVDNYIRCFDKVAANWTAFEQFALTLPSKAPWDVPARLV
jgi:dTDP-4-amino-4,6-dideoxygalactose transaminase